MNNFEIFVYVSVATFGVYICTLGGLYLIVTLTN